MVGTSLNKPRVVPKEVPYKVGVLDIGKLCLVLESTIEYNAKEREINEISQDMTSG